MNTYAVTALEDARAELNRLLDFIQKDINSAQSRRDSAEDTLTEAYRRFDELNSRRGEITAALAILTGPRP